VENVAPTGGVSVANKRPCTKISLLVRVLSSVDFPALVLAPHRNHRPDGDAGAAAPQMAALGHTLELLFEMMQASCTPPTVAFKFRFASVRGHQSPLPGVKGRALPHQIRHEIILTGLIRPGVYPRGYGRAAQNIRMSIVRSMTFSSVPRQSPDFWLGGQESDQK